MLKIYVNTHTYSNYVQKCLIEIDLSQTKIKFDPFADTITIMIALTR